MTLGLDLSGSHARAVVVDPRAQVTARGTHALSGSNMAVAASAALREATAGAARAPTGVAVALPHASDSLPPDLAKVVHERTGGAPTIVGAGVATVVAEQWCGAARDAANVVALTAAEHVVCGIMLDGRVWTGAHGRAGAVGWLALNPVERDDYRRLGGLEAEVSSGGIVRRIVWRIKSGDHSAVEEPHQGDLSKITVEEVFAYARTGDGLCVSVIRDTAKYIGMAIANLAAILDPQVIVLGGLTATFADLLIEPVRLEVQRRIGQAHAERLQIVVSSLGGDAAAIGAARLAQTRA